MTLIPVLVINQQHVTGIPRLQWAASPADASLYFPGATLVFTPDQLNELPTDLLVTLFKDYGNPGEHTLDALWDSLNRNVMIYAPGRLLHNCPPSMKVLRPARLTKHGRYMLSYSARRWTGPQQAQVLVELLHKTFGTGEFSSAEADHAFTNSKFLSRWQWKLKPETAFRWYRSRLIKEGALRMVHNSLSGSPDRLNDLPSREVRTEVLKALENAGIPTKKR